MLAATQTALVTQMLDGGLVWGGCGDAFKCGTECMYACMFCVYMRRKRGKL
jgi:hypothetical protein